LDSPHAAPDQNQQVSAAFVSHLSPTIQQYEDHKLPPVCSFITFQIQNSNKCTTYQDIIRFQVSMRNGETV
jgi:hypothetical protein